MNRKILVLAGAIVLIAAASVVAYAFFKPPETASRPIEAVRLVVETGEPQVASASAVEPTSGPEEPTAIPEEPAAAPEDPADTATPTEVPPTPTVEPTATAAAVAANTDGEQSQSPEATDDESSAVQEDTAAGPIIFEIVPDESEVRFVIDEVLRGSPKTVVGATNQVAGQLAVHPDQPGLAQVGQILVNARSLATDSEFRNRALKNRILQTDNHEFITFTPTELVGLPDQVTVGEGFSFQIVGDLTIRETTQQVAFEATVTPVSLDRLEGSASATVSYADFGLLVPDAPGVTNVADEAALEIDFVAAPVS